MKLLSFNPSTIVIIIEFTFVVHAFHSNTPFSPKQMTHDSSSIYLRDFSSKKCTSDFCSRNTTITTRVSFLNTLYSNTSIVLLLLLFGGGNNAANAAGGMIKDEDFQKLGKVIQTNFPEETKSFQKEAKKIDNAVAKEVKKIDRVIAKEAKILDRAVGDAIQSTIPKETRKSIQKETRNIDRIVKKESKKITKEAQKEMKRIESTPQMKTLRSETKNLQREVSSFMGGDGSDIGSGINGNKSQSVNRAKSKNNIQGIDVSKIKKVCQDSKSKCL